MTATMIPAEFLAKHAVTIKAEQVDAPDDADEWGQTAFHWRITLSTERGKFVTRYAMGSAHKTKTGTSRYNHQLMQSEPVYKPNPPTLDLVLGSLASDCQTAENCLTFEEFASEYGYDADSRKAEKTYNAIVAQARKIKRWLGDEAYADLLNVQD